MDDLRTASDSLAASERRLAAQSDALTELTTRYTNPGEPFEDRLRSILDISARALQVERLSLWEFDDQHALIRCGGLYHRTPGRYESGSVLHRHDFPAYFNAIDRERVVAASDARVDPRTREFRDSYLDPNGIGAMLDVPLQRDNRRLGVLCAEHVGGTRQWTVDEQNFGISVGNLIVVAIAEEQRRQALAQLAESDARAHLIVDTAHDAYIGIDSAGRIVAWNAQAQATFGWTREEVLGRPLVETIIPPAYRDGHHAGMRRFHETGEAPVVNQRLEMSAIDRSGREFPIELTVTSPMRVENGFFFGAFLRDISGRLERDAELQRAREELRSRNEALEHELTVAHELLREARERTEGVLHGDSAAAVRLRRDVHDAAASDDAWLINGPQGSDHEAVARAIHHQSMRAARAIICVNCLSLASDSTPSSGRTAEGAGVFDKLQLADGGTWYLEGIEHLPPDSQLLLVERLRALDEARRSARRPEPDVRVIVATTRDVDDLLAAGRLLPELRRALHSTLDLVPLRDRLDDLATLAPFILRRLAEQAGRAVPILSDESLQRLKNYRWPGNLRELRNVLGFALSTSQGPVLEIGEQLLDNNLRVGSYSLIERLGAGGMGEVWLARHQLLARPAAVKIVREASLGSGEDGHVRRQRFAREAQATSELQSPHTVQLYDFGITDGGGFYYVMERLRGMDLKRMIERHGPLAPERVVFLLKQACLSLAEAHALGLVHRDIKPANLFVCRLGSEYDFIKVVDFGVVSRHAHETSSQITTAGMILGTPAFLAPELVSSPTFDGRADIYALGCVAFWLLTGRPPFEANDAVSVLLHHAQTAPSPPSTMCEEVIPPQMDELILECLAKDPSRRPASAEALWERLDRVRVTAQWNQRRARTWWEMHEPELIAPA